MEEKGNKDTNKRRTQSMSVGSRSQPDRKSATKRKKGAKTGRRGRPNAKMSHTDEIYEKFKGLLKTVNRKEITEDNKCRRKSL